ncbi:MAG: hypothetical protein H6991_10080 [Pseudomonadales bacterium]|nr:hypothetical protein [Halieaceae bacterium]MCP5148600.1 hypothetical protein [Pseudomonadales bacterium]MCP5188106.1 hypothetical protein [Pseudomonadales bacterium]
MSSPLRKLGRAETAALVVETLAAHGIEVVLVGGSCVCVWTNDRFGSFDLDFVDLTYKRRKQIVAALADIGFVPKGVTRYFEHPDSEWSIEFPTAPLAIGHEQIGRERVASMDTAMGTIRLLNPTDTIKDRLLWWYLEGDRQCWEQALDIARNHKVIWADLKAWHAGEGYADRYTEFRKALK